MPEPRSSSDSNQRVTLGEVGRRLDDFRNETQRGLQDLRAENQSGIAEIRQILGGYEAKFVGRDIYAAEKATADVERERLGDRLSRVESLVGRLLWGAASVLATGGMGALAAYLGTRH